MGGFLGEVIVEMRVLVTCKNAGTGHESLTIIVRYASILVSTFSPGLRFVAPGSATHNAPPYLS